MEKEVRHMSGRINIMILIVSMPVGGVERQILSIASRLNREQYNPVICCIRDLGDLGEEAGRTGIKTFALHLMKSNRFSPRIAWRIMKMLREHNTHILWTHQYVANMYGRMASIPAGTPAVVSNFHALYDNPKMHRRLFNHVLSYRTDAMVAVSGAVASDIRTYDRVREEKIRVIHNGIDLSLFDTHVSKSDCRAQLGLSEQDVIVGTTGRLSKEKNHTVMIDALLSMPGHVKGLIIGDGPLRKKLKEAGGDRICFTGQMEYDLIPRALHAMDIFCAPSLWEGFGIAAVEAMASGLPVVASDIATHREVLGEAGLFFSEGDAGALAAALTTIMDDAALRGSLEKKAIERAGRFSMDETVNAYDRLFRDMMKTS